MLLGNKENISTLFYALLRRKHYKTKTLQVVNKNMTKISPPFDEHCVISQKEILAMVCRTSQNKAAQQ
jgi:hypothetical protein